MSESPCRVGLAKQNNRRDNIFHAMDLVREDLLPKIADQVLLKPNFLSNKNQLGRTTYLQRMDAMGVRRC